MSSKTRDGSCTQILVLLTTTGLHCKDEITPRYCSLYFTCSIDLAFQKIFKELQGPRSCFTKYKDLPPHILELAVQDILALKKSKQTSKEWVSLCTKFWQEVMTKKRDSMEELIEIIEKDVALFSS